MQRQYHQGDASQGSCSQFSTSSASTQSLRQSSEPLTPAESGSTKKVGLMHRLLAKAKVHKGMSHSHSHSSLSEQDQQDQAALYSKSAAGRHVHIADESKENYPVDAIPAQTAAQKQERSFLSSSLPTTPAGESALPFISRRSSITEDHHQKAFEASAPGRIALAIAPQLSEVKGLELLDALEEGALMRLRREHMGRSSTGMGKNAHVRCVAEGGFQARLLFDGQGLTSLLKHAHLTDRDQGVHKAIIEYVEVMEGAWHRRKSIEVHTNLGLLSLLPADAVTYATWIIGLNTALTAVELHRGDGIHPLRPARKLPLSMKLKIFDPSMALVKEEPDV